MSNKVNLNLVQELTKALKNIMPAESDQNDDQEASVKKNKVQYVLPPRSRKPVDYKKLHNTGKKS